MSIPDKKQAFEAFAEQLELKKEVSKLLYDVLSKTDVVLLCDDSASMQTAISEQGIGPGVVKKSTRWLELKKLASTLIEFVTAINSDGIDLYFLARPKILGVNNVAGLQGVFAELPVGGTPLNTTVKQIYQDKRGSGRDVLLIIVSDGEPTDASLEELKETFIRKPYNFHISFAECTDDKAKMEYLDEWDNEIPNFDNTDDYREELERVKQKQGVNFKFDYNDYVIKILLATFSKKYFNLDQIRVSQGDGCSCIIL